MSPRMRPSSTCRSIPSSATVAPKVLRRPRASMHTMASVLLLFLGIRLARRPGAAAKLAVDRLTVIPLTVHQVSLENSYQSRSERAHASVRPVQVEVRVHRLVGSHDECPVLDVMARVDQGEHRVVHVAVFRAPTDVS